MAQSCHAYLWLCPCDACAKGELEHAEATPTSDLVFGISNFAAIELYAHIGIVPRQNGHGEPRHLDTSTASTASTQTSTPRHRSHMESALTDLDRPRHKPRHRLDRASTASTPRQTGLCPSRLMLAVGTRAEIGYARVREPPPLPRTRQQHRCTVGTGPHAPSPRPPRTRQQAPLTRRARVWTAVNRRCDG